MKALIAKELGDLKKGNIFSLLCALFVIFGFYKPLQLKSPPFVIQIWMLKMNMFFENTYTMVCIIIH